MSYWGLNDGLTISAVFPHLQLLQARPDVAAVRLVTIERGPDARGALAFEPGFAAGKISFEPLRSRLSGNVILNKIEDFTRFPKELIRQIAGFRPDFYDCGGRAGRGDGLPVVAKNEAAFLRRIFRAAR